MSKKVLATFDAMRCLASQEDDLSNLAKDGWQIRRVKELLPKAFPPDGHPPDNLTLQAIQTCLRPFLKKGSKLPSTDSIARALGRRSSRA